MNNSEELLKHNICTIYKNLAKREKHRNIFKNL